MLLKVKSVLIDKDILINPDMILYIVDNNVYFTPSVYIVVRDIDITNIKRIKK